MKTFVKILLVVVIISLLLSSCAEVIYSSPRVHFRGMRPVSSWISIPVTGEDGPEKPVFEAHQWLYRGMKPSK